MDKGRKFFKDGVTTFADPFWDMRCERCGIGFYAVDLSASCPKCKSSRLRVTNNQHIIADLDKFNKYR